MARELAVPETQNDALVSRSTRRLLQHAHTLGQLLMHNRSRRHMSQSVHPWSTTASIVDDAASAAYGPATTADGAETTAKLAHAPAAAMSPDHLPARRVRTPMRQAPQLWRSLSSRTSHLSPAPTGATTTVASESMGHASAASQTKRLLPNETPSVAAIDAATHGTLATHVECQTDGTSVTHAECQTDGVTDGMAPTATTELPQGASPLDVEPSSLWEKLRESKFCEAVLREQLQELEQERTEAVERATEAERRAGEAERKLAEAWRDATEATTPAELALRRDSFEAWHRQAPLLTVARGTAQWRLRGRHTEQRAAAAPHQPPSPSPSLQAADVGEGTPAVADADANEAPTSAPPMEEPAAADTPVEEPAETQPPASPPAASQRASTAQAAQLKRHAPVLGAKVTRPRGPAPVDTTPPPRPIVPVPVLHRGRLLRLQGQDASEVHASGITAKEACEAGYKIRELLRAGYTAKQLREAGESAAQLKRYGCTALTLLCRLTTVLAAALRSRPASTPSGPLARSS